MEKKKNIEEQYLEILQKLVDTGEIKKNRTGVDTLYLFSEKIRGNLRDGFPLLTTKKVLFSKVVDELFWFLSGSKNINDLPEDSQNIWAAWAKEDGDLGKTYGYQFRKVSTLITEQEAAKIKKKHKCGKDCFESAMYAGESDNDSLYKYNVDQIKRIQYLLKNDPNSRRMVIDLWNVTDLYDMALEPCAYTSVFSVIGNKLNCHVTMRSADFAVGVPFNIASYALLTHMFAHVTGLMANEISFEFVDCHLYINHVENVKKQLDRLPYDLPKIKFNVDTNDIDLIKKDDFEIIDYKHHSFIKLEVAV